MPPTPRASPRWRQKKILIAPFLEMRVIDRRPVPRADCFPGLMKVDHVLPVRIIRRQIGTAAEPCCPLGEKAKVGVHRRHHRVARMQHQRDAGGGEWRPSPGTWAANSGDICPKTSEKLTPAFSKTPPSARRATARRRPPRAVARRLRENGPRRRLPRTRRRCDLADRERRRWPVSGTGPCQPWQHSGVREAG